MWYRTGKISVVSGSAAVTGAGTAWVENARVGDGLQGPDGRVYEITNIASNTALSITPAYIGASASSQTYWILPVQGYVKRSADRLAAVTSEIEGMPGRITQTESDIENIEQSMLTKNGNLADLTDRTKARENLGLGDSSTRNVGTAHGQVLPALAGGLASVSGSVIDLSDPNVTCGFYAGRGASEPAENLPWATSGFYGSAIVSRRGTASNGTSIMLFDGRKVGASVYDWNSGSWIRHEFRTTQNSAVDSNGFIKSASPIIQLYSEKITRTDDLEIKDAEFKRFSTGHYEIRNVPQLSRDGWYIETPKDRNNNIYFTVDYEENIEEKTLTIRTYEPDYSSGRAVNGSPVDILDGRFISLKSTIC